MALSAASVISSTATAWMLCWNQQFPMPQPQHPKKQSLLLLLQSLSDSMWAEVPAWFRPGHRKAVCFPEKYLVRTKGRRVYCASYLEGTVHHCGEGRQQERQLLTLHLLLGDRNGRLMHCRTAVFRTVLSVRAMSSQ